MSEGPVRQQFASVTAFVCSLPYSMRGPSLGPSCQQYLCRAAPGLGLACATASRPAQAPKVGLGRARRRRPPLQTRQPVSRRPRQLSRRVLVCLPLSTLQLLQDSCDWCLGAGVREHGSADAGAVAGGAPVFPALKQ